MGSKITNWCDRCGKVVNANELSTFMFGQVSEFKTDGKTIVAENKYSLCEACLDSCKIVAFSWGKNRHKPYQPQDQQLNT